MSQPAASGLEEPKAASRASGTSTGDTLSPAELVERVRTELARIAGREADLVSVKGEAIGAAEIAERAKAELARITGLHADHVSAVVHQPDGWHVTVDLVELRRIPAATDVLAAYEALLGPTGVLLSYHRTRRYFRDQMIEES